MPVRRPIWLWFVPVISLLLTAFAWHATRVSTSAHTQERFRFRSDAFQAGVRQLVSTHENVLHGVVGLFEASGQVTRATWSDYLEAVHPESSTAGFLTIGYSARVAPTERAALERTVRAEGLPFALWPQGTFEDAQPIVYVHPLNDANRRVLGFDMFSEPLRREAMMRARDTGAAALSGQVRLVQSDGRPVSRPGLLLYVPVYAGGHPPQTIAQRRAKLRGFVYAVVRAQDLIRSVFSAQHWDIDVEIYDGMHATEQTLLFRSTPERNLRDAMPDSIAFVHREALEIAGRRWLVIAAPSTNFVSTAERNQHWLIAGGGMAITLMFSIGLWASAAVRQRALVLAEGMAEVAGVSDAQTQLMIDSITDHAIFRLDDDRNVTSWNAGAERMLGYSEEEAMSSAASRFWVGTDGNPYLADNRITERQSREGWHVRKDGHRFWGAAAVAPLQHGTRGASGFVVILRDDTSRRRAMEALAEASAALEQRTVELGRFNRLASGRELRMIELKRMVNDRSTQLGMQAPFDLAFADDFADVPLSTGESS